eukprot:TRINITY_DN822_c0_g1_i1.p1 TRINITY_DN822_c0_g1~~TRINITY_DN822_c0_g1_i1.p1  ORF type:complete len:174 (-),score=39.65 TRINITY_DN822_c0_g1_i1:341-862(-)
MVRPATPLPTFLLLLLLVASQAIHPRGPSNPRTSIFNQTKMRSVLDQFVEAANQLDGMQIGGLFAEDGTFQDGAGTAVMRGRENITLFWEQGFSPKWLTALNFVPTNVATDGYGNANLAGEIAMTVAGKRGPCWVHLPEAFIIRFGNPSYEFESVRVVYDDGSETSQIAACMS